ncbi:MAG TPA: hypothetical protein DEQ26_01505 [Flavobacteriaceae bacterium]|nr:hypothetical protein [Flavobacteriaceae bacterium]
MKKIFTLLSIIALSSATFAQQKEKAVKTLLDFEGNVLKSNTKTDNLNKKAVDLSIGFEVSEGYKLGDINKQNGWSVTGTNAEGTAFVQNQNIVSDKFHGGALSFLAAKDTRYGKQSSAIVGGFYSKGAESLDDVEVYVMVGIDNASSYIFSTVNNAAESYVDQIRIIGTGNIWVADYEVGQYADTGFVASANTWYKLSIKYNTKDNKVEYFVDDELAYERFPSDVATEMITDEIRVTHDNAATTTKIYADDIKIGAGSLATSEVNKTTKVKVYPNPASDFVKINNPSSEKIESITIGDLTGRTVKYVDTKSSTIDVQSLPSGVYLLKIKTDKGMKIEKIIKK